MEKQQGRTMSDVDIREMLGTQQGRDISEEDLNFFNQINNPAVDNRSTFRTFLDNFSGNLQRESDRKLSENKALTEYVQSPEGQRASTAVGLGVASLLPIPGAKTRFANQMANIMNPVMSSGARVGTDVVNRFLSPLGQYGRRATTNRGPRGPINIEQPTQGNLDLTKLKDTGITSLTNRMNPKMRNDLLGRRDRIQQDVIRMDGMRNAGEPVDMNRLFRLQDELDALNKTLK
tara:strand:+ start:158 stop:856 length:699 start_codon:yes stop_codon:yes gene_type:complete